MIKPTMSIGQTLHFAQPMAYETKTECAQDCVALWTRRMAAGQDEAWRWFHERYYWFLLRYATSRTGDPAGATDIVQETYLRVARHIRIFTDEDEFRSWLACVVRCAAVDHARHIARRSTLLERFAHWRQCQCPSALEVYNSRNAESVLAEEALALLSGEDALLLRRKYYEGWSTEELAADGRTTLKSIESRLARLRQRVRELICRTR